MDSQASLATVRAWSQGLRGRVTLWFLCLGLVPLLLIGGASYLTLSEALSQRTLQHLAEVRDTKAELVHMLLQEWQRDALELAGREPLKPHFRTVQEWRQEVGPTRLLELVASGAVRTEGEREVLQADRVLRAVLGHNAQVRGHENAVFVDSDGYIRWSLKPVEFSAARLQDSPLQQFYQAVSTQASDGVVLSDVLLINGYPRLFAAVPVMQGQVRLGALVIRLPWERLNKLMGRDLLLQDVSAEAYLIGADKRMRTDSRLDSRYTAAASLASGEGAFFGVDTESARAALQGRSGTYLTRDYRGVEVLSASTPVAYGGLSWVLLVEVDAEEAQGVIHPLLANIAWVAGLTLLMGWVIAQRVGRRLAEPLIDAVERLVNAGSEILSATAQMAAGAAEHGSAVAQTTATVNEVQHISRQAAEGTESIAQNARTAKATMARGQKAVGSTIQSMEKVRLQVEEVAEHILNLAEQTQAIGDIIGSVNEVAEQTNLLALNAGIEASRAGEAGRGFTIVATEVRQLAAQSRDATRQVEKILGDIQKATNGLVLATEESSKSVYAAVGITNDTGGAIQELSQVIAEAGQLGSQAAAASHQQYNGMTQIQQAMEDIEEVARQNLASSRQVEQAAFDLNKISQQLRELVVGSANG